MSSMNRFLSGVIRAPSDWNSYGDNHFQSAGCPAPAATRHSHPTPSASLRHSIPQSGLVHYLGLNGPAGSQTRPVVEAGFESHERLGLATTIGSRRMGYTS